MDRTFKAGKKHTERQSHMPHSAYKVDERLYRMLDGTLSKKAAKSAFAYLIILTHATTGPILLPAAGNMYFHKAHWLLRHDRMCMMQLLEPPLSYCTALVLKLVNATLAHIL